MAQRFEVGQVNEVQALTGGGADMSSMGIASFTAAKAEVSLTKPTPSVAPGGMA